MTILKKTTAIIVGSLLTLTLILGGVGLWLEHENRQRVEAADIDEALTRGLAAIAHATGGLSTKAKDLASQSETYAFIQATGSSSLYAQADAVLETLRNLHVNVLLITDTAGRFVYGVAVDPATQSVLPVPVPVLELFGEGSPQVQAALTQGILTGLVDLPEGPLLVAARPVLTNLGEGPVRGLLLLGVYANSGGYDGLPALSGLTNLTLALYSVAPERTRPDDVQRAYETLLAGQTQTVHISAGDTLTGYRLVPDVTGQPALLLRVSLTRPKGQWGQASVALGIAALILVNMLFGGLIIVTLDRQILSRLYRLGGAVRAVAQRQEPGARLEVLDNDELSQLAREINRLLASLESSAAERERAQAEIQLLARFPEENPTPVLRLDLDGTILYANTAGRQLIEALQGTAPALDAVVAAWDDAVAEAVHTRRRVEREYEGAGHWFACTFAPMLEAGYLNVYGADITRARQLASDLQAQRDFAMQVMNTMGQGLTVTNQSNQFEYVNPAYARMLGYMPEELVGRSPIELTFPEDHARLAEARARRVAGAVSTYETRLRRLDGGAVHALITGAPRWHDSQIDGAIAVVTDVTEQKQLEAALRARLEFDEIVAAVSAELIDITPEDVDGAITRALGRLGRTAGVDRAYVFQLSGDGQTAANTHEWCADGVPAEIDNLQTIPVSAVPWWMEQLAAEAEINVPSVAALPAAADAEKTLLAAQGVQSVLVVPLVHRRAVLGFLGLDAVRAARIWPDDTVALLHLVGQLIVNTLARMRAEAALRASEALYRSLLQTSPDGVAVIDPHGQLTYVSDRLAEMGGYASAEEFRAHGALEHLLLPNTPASPVALWRQLSAAGLTPHNLHIRRRDGTYYVGEVKLARLLDHQGRPASVMAVVRDVTERERAKAEIIQLNRELESRVGERTQQLAEANQDLERERALLAQRVAERTADLSVLNAELARAARAKDEFLASMSHELRTPLNTILGMSEVVLEGLLGPLTHDQQESIGSIEESGRHLLALINDILDISKIEAGRLELQMGAASVDAVCQASLRLVREVAQKKGLRLQTSLDPAVTDLVADERRLKQMLVNLLSNACKFTPEGGGVGLEVVGDAAAEAVRFTVWDTGIGIAPEDQARLFQPFVQVDSRLSRQYSGSGLGLSLVRRMAELHGGGVSLVSAPGQGSRFTIALPWRVPEGEPVDEPVADPGEPEPAAARPAPPLTAPRILVADDNEANIRTFTRMLADEFRLLVARTGTESVRQAVEARPDLILMDIQMPEMDGLEATRRIRQQLDVPIIALTALAMAGDRERCLEAGADDYLTKPVGLRQLRAAIHALLQPQLA